MSVKNTFLVLIYLIASTTYASQSLANEPLAIAEDRVQANFAAIDGNTDAVLTLEEFEAYENDAFKKLDADSNGFLTKDECDYACHLQTPGGVAAEENPAFQGKVFQHEAMDKNQDGKVLTDEFSGYVKDLFARSDANKDSALSAQEYKALEAYSDEPKKQ